MTVDKPSICLICDKEGFKWIPLLMSEWKIKYLFCNDQELKNCYVETFGLYDTETNKSDNTLKYLDELSPEKIHLLFLALSTNKYHEVILEYVINQKKFFYIFSSNVPTLNIQKLEKLRSLLNNFNAHTNYIYDIKKEYKNVNKQFYWNIFNPLLNERVFYNLKNTLNDLGYIYAVQIESTFIPFSVENEGITNILLYRSILIISLIEYLFEKPKKVLSKCYSIKSDKETVHCLAGNVFYNSLTCYFNISVNTLNKIFALKIYGNNGFIEVSYSKEHNCFQMQRCLNHYEYPNLFVEDSYRSALNEIKYFLDEKLYTNKYINAYINAVHTSLCLWKSDGENIALENFPENCTSQNGNELKKQAELDAITA
ncbi:hypothetical protein MKS88_005758 [Plasmodium brasilianum]|uniref:Uncharacterized protein n=2 Tax=Plasmodium (Plasmodium) TaxID=418103 RepID=A0A1D3TFF5_PLAMA|nr:conserved Plasmodium protein, unknown function [Plasmodium malariae]KAI4835075.1 hypothetical protein MKS88_005758 [Plasmodium brasilianum]SCP03651.1 conserved Plasmodium protein, unknown function [Plasmodium malariae]